MKTNDLFHVVPCNRHAAGPSDDMCEGFADDHGIPPAHQTAPCHPTATGGVPGADGYGNQRTSPESEAPRRVAGLKRQFRDGEGDGDSDGELDVDGPASAAAQWPASAKRWRLEQCSTHGTAGTGSATAPGTPSPALVPAALGFGFDSALATAASAADGSAGIGGLPAFVPFAPPARGSWGAHGVGEFGTAPGKAGAADADGTQEMDDCSWHAGGAGSSDWHTSEARDCAPTAAWSAARTQPYAVGQAPLHHDAAAFRRSRQNDGEMEDAS